MKDDAIRIIRETMLWGIGAITVAAILRALGAAIAPLAVLVGVVYAVIAVKFYGVVVAALFQQPGALFRFGVWFPIKIAIVIGFVVFSSRLSTHEIFSLIFGSLVFIPAAFRYALREAAAPLVEEDPSGVDHHPDPPSTDGGPSAPV